MGWMKVIHGYAAYVFIASVLAARHLDVHRQQVRALGQVHSRARVPAPRASWPTMRFYLFAAAQAAGVRRAQPGRRRDLHAGVRALFSRHRHRPHPARRERRRRLAVCAGSPRWRRSSAACRCARWIHHVVMWLLLGFAVHHVYSAILMSTVEANATMESIFSGYKFVPREDLEYSGYRFINRKAPGR